MSLLNSQILLMPQLSNLLVPGLQQFFVQVVAVLRNVDHFFDYGIGSAHFTSGLQLHLPSHARLIISHGFRSFIIRLQIDKHVPVRKRPCSWHT